MSPTLIVKSLNPDAQRLIQIHGLQLKTVEENYNQGANEQFLQDKAIEIVDRQIQRLKQEICQIASQILRSKATSLFYMQNLKKKNAKLSALREIKVQIRNKFPQTSLHSIIEDATERYPELTSGLFQHVVDDYLKVILEMEKYHQANCKETVKNLPQAVK